MTDDLNIWLDGAPVIPMPGGEQFEVWLDGAPVVTMGGDSATASVTGTEIVTETGTVTATGGAVATVTGSECLTETGTVGVIGEIPVTGEECTTETGTVTATGGATAQVEGSECQTETGTVTVTTTPPVPPTPLGYGGNFDPRHKRHRVYKFPKSKKKRPARYRKPEKVEFDPILETYQEIPRLPEPVFTPKTVVARVQGTECSSSTGICNAKVDHPDDQETIKLILEVLSGLEIDENSAKTMEESNEIREMGLGRDDSEDLELILMISDEL